MHSVRIKLQSHFPLLQPQLINTPHPLPLLIIQRIPPVHATPPCTRRRREPPTRRVIFQLLHGVLPVEEVLVRLVEEELGVFGRGQAELYFLALF
jgi:hypothetical protein